MTSCKALLPATTTVSVPSCPLLQLVPELLPPDAIPPTPSPAPLSPAPRSPAPGGPGQDGDAAPASSPTDGQPELQAAVAAGLEAAKDAVATVLGREARAMLLVSCCCALCLLPVVCLCLRLVLSGSAYAQSACKWLPVVDATAHGASCVGRPGVCTPTCCTALRVLTTLHPPCPHRLLMQRRVSLADTTAEAKLGQLASALTLFIESDA